MKTETKRMRELELKRYSLRRKLQLSFQFLLLGAIFIAMVFSILFSYGFIMDEAKKNMRKNIEVANLLYQAKEKEVANFAQDLADDRVVRMLVDLDVRNKLSELLKSIVNRETVYQVSVLNKALDVMSSVTLDGTPLGKYRSIDFEKNGIVESAASGKAASGTEVLLSKEEANLFCISAAAPIVNNNVVQGVVLVRYCLNGNTELVGQVKSLLDVNAAVYQNGTAVSATEHSMITSEDYSALMKKGKTLERLSLNPGGLFSEYMTLYDIDDRPAGVLGINVPSEQYTGVLLNSVIVFAMIGILLFIASIFVVRIIAKSILVPMNQLMDGVQRISTGDLTYAVTIDLKDEIGQLSRAFDEMRLALNDKISTIEDMNKGLEKQVRDRTQQIENLLNQMKKYLSPQLYRSISGGQTEVTTKKHARKKLTVFFSDIKNFTMTTESMEPQDLSNLLNNYLDNMAKIAIKWGGTIDKFVGDAVMVFFGDPEFIDDKTHALRAVRMALEMREKLTELRGEWESQGFKRPFHCRIGINTGYCTVGNFGSENKMDYTIIGANVNLAARLEAAAEPDGILISERTYDLIREEIYCEAGDALELKGIAQPVPVYTVLYDKNREPVQEFLHINENGIAFDNVVLDPKNISRPEREKLAKNLKIAAALAEGRVKYVFDDTEKIWKMVKAQERAAVSDE